MHKKNKVYLLEHQTIRNQTLLKQLVRSLVPNVSSAHAAMVARIVDNEKQIRDAYAAMVARIVDNEKQMRAETSRAVVDYEKQMRAAASRAVEAHQYFQKQSNLEFPNIIRGRLPVKPSNSPISEQFPASLPESLLTATTGEVYEEIAPEIIPVPSPELVPITDHQKVFIVHGHDHESRDAIADFVDNWGLIPTVLDEQPSGSRTIIEKFEQCADEANFAIVLMTPDDVGASMKSRTDLKPRARQNVIFELGYFFGSKGRKRVCILYKEGVELPSDIHGVVYVPMDDEGKWQKRVIREMMDSDILIKKNKV